jgi:hypothetical protein
LIRSLNWAKENVGKDNGAPRNPEIFKAKIKASSAVACLYNIAHLGGTSSERENAPKGLGWRQPGVYSQAPERQKANSG